MTLSLKPDLGRVDLSTETGCNRDMKNFFLSIALILTALGCVSKVVNPDFNATGSVLLPAGAVGEGTNQRIQDGMSARPTAAVEGQVQLEADLPTPLSGVELALYKPQAAGTSKELSRITSETDGSFRITKKLPYGKYELRILDKRYKGSMTVDLEDRPAKGLIFLVKKNSP